MIQQLGKNQRHFHTVHFRNNVFQFHAPLIAIAAFSAMLARIADPTLPARTILLPPQLVVRESCGAYPPRYSKS